MKEAYFARFSCNIENLKRQWLHWNRIKRSSMAGVPVINHSYDFIAKLSIRRQRFQKVKSVTVMVDSNSAMINRVCMEIVQNQVEFITKS